MFMTRLNRIFTICLLMLGIFEFSTPVQPAHAILSLPGQGCTTFYASDGQVALGGNNEDFNNPLTLVWFIPASQGRHGIVYFGFDDYIPQGGLNDEGLFFDGLALEYKEMPLTSQRPEYPAGMIALLDQVLATSTNVEDVIEFYSQWKGPAGELYQQLYGDSFGNSVILDGDTVLRKQGDFQIATNFRLIDHSDTPYPDERYGVVSSMFTAASQLNVELFRQMLDAAHQEGDFATVYSQIYELNEGIIHLYQFHDFRREVVLNLADELAKGPHVMTIASLFPTDPEYEQWTANKVQQWKTTYQSEINTEVDPANLAWMSGQYIMQEEAEAGPVKVYLENSQVYLQKPNQLPIEMYPSSPTSVFHHFYNGEDLVLTFQRGKAGRASAAEGAFSFEAYNINLPSHLTRIDVPSSGYTLPYIVGGLVLAVILISAILWLVRKRSGKYA